MLEKEFQYYIDHEAELLKSYGGKYIVIKNQTVVGSYEKQIDAYNESEKMYELGTFLIQRCVPNGYTQTFHSRVSFHK